jgi:hypothetical protein
MDPTGQSLLKLLFNQGETVCVSNNEFAFHSVPLENVLDGTVELISPNDQVPTRSVHSLDLTLVAINPINGFRLDSNVTAFRSYLIEMDTGSIKDQLGTIAHLKMPFSAQVFSGNKSVHTVITLDEDLPDEKTYRNVGDWLFNIMTLADKNCRNPSRSVRIPGAYREPNKKQRLIRLNDRISHKEFFEWLNRFEHLRPKAKEKKIIPEGYGDFSLLSPWATWMLKNGIDFKNRGRNQTWYALAYDFALAGYTEEQTIEELSKRFEEERDFKEKEWLTTIASAFKGARDNS